MTAEQLLGVLALIGDLRGQITAQAEKLREQAEQIEALGAIVAASRSEATSESSVR